MAYKRKTITEYRVLVNYGAGWEHEATEFSWKELRDRLKEYRASCQYAVKPEVKRVKIEQN